MTFRSGLFGVGSFTAHGGKRAGLQPGRRAREKREQVTKKAEPKGRQRRARSEPRGRAGFDSSRNSSFQATGGKWPQAEATVKQAVDLVVRQ